MALVPITCVANSEKERLIMSSTDRSSVRRRLRIMLYVRRNWLASLPFPTRQRGHDAIQHEHRRGGVSMHVYTTPGSFTGKWTKEMAMQMTGQMD
jgi:hypothetical protein